MFNIIKTKKFEYLYHIENGLIHIVGIGYFVN